MHFLFSIYFYFSDESKGTSTVDSLNDWDLTIKSQQSPVVLNKLYVDTKENQIQIQKNEEPKPLTEPSKIPVKKVQSNGDSPTKYSQDNKQYSNRNSNDKQNNEQKIVSTVSFIIVLAIYLNTIFFRFFSQKMLLVNQFNSKRESEKNRQISLKILQ